MKGCDFMKRILRCGLLVALFTFQLICCSNISSNKSKNKIMKTAYNWLDNTSKSDILNWETATVEEVNFEEEHVVATKTASADIRNIEAYKVTFTTHKDELLGPIVIYLDKNNLNVLGLDFRE